MRKCLRKLLRSSQVPCRLGKISTTNMHAGTLQRHKMESVWRQGIFHWELQAYQSNHIRKLLFGKRVHGHREHQVILLRQAHQYNWFLLLRGNDIRSPSQVLGRGYCCLHLKLAAELGIVHMLLDLQACKILKLQCHGGLLQKRTRPMGCRVGFCAEATRGHCVEFQRKPK